MARMQVTDEGTGRTYWFSPDRAKRYGEDCRLSAGGNLVSVNTGSEWHHEELYHTVSGHWLRVAYSNYEGHPLTARNLSDDEAKEWLVRNDHESAAEAEFGSLPEENLGGRPPVGPAVQVRIPADDLTRLDADAAERGISRAQWVREAIAAQLSRA